jgi:hypothetical protein
LQTAKLFLEIKNSTKNFTSLLQLYGSSLRSVTGDMPITSGTLSGTLPLAYSGTEAGIYTMVSLSENWRLYGRLSMMAKDFANLATPSNVKRRDLITTIYVKMKYDFNRRWNAFAVFNLLQNQSTLGANELVNKNYSEQISKLGLQWSW